MKKEAQDALGVNIKEIRVSGEDFPQKCPIAENWRIRRN